MKKPKDILLIVTGGAGKHSAFMSTFGVQMSITRRIEFSGNQAICRSPLSACPYRNPRLY